MGLFDRFRGHEYADEEFIAASDMVVYEAEERQSEAIDRYYADNSPVPRESATTETVRAGVYGTDGDSYSSYGYLYSGGPDVNPLLSGRNKFIVYNEMRRSDPAVRSLLWLFKLPIRAATWKVEPASDQPEDQLVAEAVRRQFGLEGYPGRLDLSWDDSLAQALLYLDWGSMWEELVWGDVESWEFDDGTTRLMRPLNRLAPRQPDTIIFIQDDPNTGLVEWIEQDIPGARPVPGDKLAWYVLEKEGKNFWGTSLLRPCYGPWRLKKALLISAAIGFDRFASGIPVVRYPEGGGTADELKAQRIGQNIRTHERAWVALPGPDPTKGGEWGVEILHGNTSLFDPTNVLRHYDEQIAMAGLQMFARLGTSETGSRAVGEVLGEPFYMAAQSIGDQIADARSRRALRKFVDVNFGTDVELPYLRVSKIGSKAIDKLASALANLSSAGFNFTDRDTQNNVRDELNLPELPEPLANEIKNLPDEAGLEAVGLTTPPTIAPRADVPQEGSRTQDIP